ncbi:MAG: lytic transglycosylase domain-containing protein [Rhodobacteraceae bacterium]|nr:lytic transglycosylase domain-containing protein [Paracoccaceae bacterium]MYE37706.1 lytic transglycosylase domain-containing protein [Paracoccaceae bacterium]
MISLPFWRVVVGGALLFLLVCTSSLASPSTQDTRNFKLAFESASKGKWEEAYAYAKQVSDLVAVDVVQWLHLRAGIDDWQAYQTFLEENGDWPGLKILRRSGEKSFSGDENPNQVVDYFSDYYPQDGFGAVRHAEALKDLQRPREASRVIRNAILSLPFSDDDLKYVIQYYPGETIPLLESRLDNLLWLDRIDEAEILLPYLKQDQQALYKARISLDAMKEGVNDLINRIPQEYISDPGLAYDRILWRDHHGHYLSALQLLLEQSSSVNDLGKPVFWASKRYRLAHELMRDGQNQFAYDIASKHFLTKNDTFHSLDWLSKSDIPTWEKKQRNSYLDLEWLAGYIALRKLNDPQRALGHFYNYYQEVIRPSYSYPSYSPVRLGRAGYWLGVAHESAGNNEDARIAYQFGARFQTSFYGQLSAEKINYPTSKTLISREPVNNRVVKMLQREKVVRAAVLFHSAGIEPYAGWFLAHQAEKLDREELAALAQIAQTHGANFSTVKIAKQGTRQGDMILDYLYPIPDLATQNLPTKPEVTLSIIRQETEFRPQAVSHKGALGLMQVLPNTGEEIADDLGIRGPIKEVLLDQEYNVQIGSAYLQVLFEEFNGVNVLVYAAYNAGPGRLNGWLKTLGKPGESTHSIIDWIEHIPYSETRNYVMRVLESITVYQHRFSERISPIRISSLL